MDTQTDVVPAEESNNTGNAEETTTPEVETEASLSKVLETDEPKKHQKMVPESVLIEYKREAKTVRKELDELRRSIQDGATKTEVAQSIKDLAGKHGVDAEFLDEFASAVRKETESAFEERLAASLKPIEEKAKADKREQIFNEHFEKTLAELPEFAKVVNKEVIRTLAFDPKNANKTFTQIFEESYGHVVTGRKTLEPTKPRGGKGDASVDFNRARADAEYFQEIMADPELKRKYNAELAQRIKL